MIDKWDKRFLNLARHIGEWSKDPSTKVGSIITRDKVILSYGYNGFPSGCDDDEKLYLDRELKYKRIIHAEKNAIMLSGHDLTGGTVYVTMPPCSQCAGMIIQMKLIRVVSLKPHCKEVDERWEADLAIARGMLDEVKIFHEEYNPEDLD